MRRFSHMCLIGVSCETFVRLVKCDRMELFFPDCTLWSSLRQALTLLLFLFSLAQTAHLLRPQAVALRFCGCDLAQALALLKLHWCTLNLITSDHETSCDSVFV